MPAERNAAGESSTDADSRIAIERKQIVRRDHRLHHRTRRLRMEKLDRITQRPEVMGGKACIRGIRVTVGMIVGQIGAGRSVDELLAEYPYLEREDILQALRYAAWRAEEREVVLAECGGSACGSWVSFRMDIFFPFPRRFIGIESESSCTMLKCRHRRDLKSPEAWRSPSRARDWRPSAIAIFNLPIRVSPSTHGQPIDAQSLPFDSWFDDPSSEEACSCRLRHDPNR